MLFRSLVRTVQEGPAHPRRRFPTGWRRPPNRPAAPLMHYSRACAAEASVAIPPLQATDRPCRRIRLRLPLAHERLLNPTRNTNPCHPRQKRTPDFWHDRLFKEVRQRPRSGVVRTRARFRLLSCASRTNYDEIEGMRTDRMTIVDLGDEPRVAGETRHERP